MIRSIAIAAALLASTHAQAYCVYNELKDREVLVDQEMHPDPLRDDRRFRGTIAAGASKCCNFHELDCNPGGRANSLVNLGITLPGEPVYECAFPPGTLSNAKVTGAGTIRIQHNPNAKSANPYIIRIRTADKDLTGPRGVPCTEPKPKAAPPAKGKK
jgi:hypothetical protein